MRLEKQLQARYKLKNIVQLMIATTMRQFLIAIIAVPVISEGIWEMVLRLIGKQIYSTFHASSDDSSEIGDHNIMQSPPRWLVSQLEKKVKVVNKLNANDPARYIQFVLLLSQSIYLGDFLNDDRWNDNISYD